MSESFAELFQATLQQSTIRPGEILRAKVVGMTQAHVVVHAGLKSEAYIPIEEFRDESGACLVHVGDDVDVALEAMEDGFGSTRLSRERAKRLETWADLERACKNGDIVVGRVSGRVKGGLAVEIRNVRAFLPGSLVDLRPVSSRDLSHWEGRDLELIVIKTDPHRNNVVVSHKAVLERKENQEERQKLLENLTEGQEVTGVVKNMTHYGAFVYIGGGVDGLLHITDMSWKRMRHPGEMLNVGDEIRVRVLKFDRERNRVSLGLKQMGDDPFVDVARRFPVHSRLLGRVTNVLNYGCFVELEEGVEGLVYVSEMDWTNKNIDPNKVVSVGDEVEVMVLDVEESRRRISLGIKQCLPNPWQSFAISHEKGEIMVGKVKSITDFGIFLGLEGGIDGLVRLSDLSWDQPGEEVVRHYRKGQEVRAVILSIDSERERISLGIKQLEGERPTAGSAEIPSETTEAS